MILPNDTTIAVADGERVRLFRNKGLEPHLKVVEMETPDLASDNCGSGARHRSMLANPDNSRQQEDSLAAAATDYLNRRVLAGQ